MLNEVVVTSPTIGSNVEEVQFKNMKFLMWDVGGQESLRSSWTTYYTAVEVSLYGSCGGAEPVVTERGWGETDPLIAAARGSNGG